MSADDNRVLIVGAGLAGLAAALSLSAGGRPVTVIEAAAQAGGRCRSYRDSVLDRVIDNGNHLMMTANTNVFAYLDEIGARDRVAVAAPAAYPFIDVTTGERWTLRPNAGPLPWWILSRRRNVRGARLRDYLEGRRLLTAGEADTVADRLRADTVLWRRFWEPLTVAVLNIAPEEGAAALLATVCRLTFAKGEAAARPVTVREGLADALIDPAVSTLKRRGVVFRFRERLRSIETCDGRATALHTSHGKYDLAASERVILATPPWVTGDILPGLKVPEGARMILNLHFRLAEPPPVCLPLIGLTGSLAQWLFLRDDIASVTVSAADAFAETPAEEIAARVWPEVAIALGLDPSAPPPPVRVVKEKRATFAATPANEARRPGAVSPLANLFLAGDWTVRGIPATIEGAILSGRRAAALTVG